VTPLICFPQPPGPGEPPKEEAIEMKLSTALCLAILCLIPQSTGSVATAQDPLTIWTWSDSAGSCVLNGSTVDQLGCCGSPGQRECGYVIKWNKGGSPGCTDPDQNILRNNSYDGTVVCNLDSPAKVIPAPPPTSTSATFYVGSDYHVFRGTFDPAIQSHFPGTLAQWATSKAPWPSNSGIPAGDTVSTPVAMVMAGDITTGGGVNELAAYRSVWEAGTLTEGWSFPYPVFPGLGNHDLVDAGIAGAGASTSAQRMWDYIGNAMSLFNIDKNSLGLLGIDDGQGTHNYSWDWNGVHYVQLNTWAGETNQYNSPISSGLTWLASDLSQNVGSSNRPIVIFQHYDLSSVGSDETHEPVFDAQEHTYFQTWWTLSQYTSFWNVIRDYNVVATFSGHVHSWDVQRPEHYQGYYPAMGNETLPNTDSKGNAKIYDVFVSHPLGYGSFFSVRVTPDYLDVASWTSPAIFAAPQPDSSSKMFGGTAACRKKINTRFLDYSSLVSIGYTGSGVTATNTSQFTLPGQLAFRLATQSNIENRSFVDSCDAYFGNAYIDVTSPGGALTPGTSVSTGVTTSSFYYSASLIQLAPIGFKGALLTNVSSIHVDGVNQPQQSLYFFAPVGVVAPFTASISYPNGVVGNWLSASPIAGTQGATGGFALTFNSSLLNSIVGSETANVTITAAGGDSVTVPVTVTVTPSLQISSTSIDFSTASSQTLTLTESNGGALNFKAIVLPGFSVSPATGTTPAVLTVTPTNDNIGGKGTYQTPLAITTVSPSPSSKVVVNVNLSVAEVVVAASAPAIPITVDGSSYTGTSPTLRWNTGTSHTLSAPSTEPAGPQQYRFASWSNSGNQSQTIVGPAAGSYRYVAAYTTYDLLTITANPGASGGIVQTTPVASDFYFADGSTVTLTALDNSSYYFAGFSGAITAQQSPQIVTMDGPQKVTANYSPVNGAGMTKIAATVPSIGVQVDNGISWVAPVTFHWNAGEQHTVNINPQQVTPSSQLAFQSWPDGYASATRVISGIRGGAQSFTANVGMQYLVNVTPSPASAGTISGAGFANAASRIVLTATPAAGFTFAGFSGDVNSSQNGLSVPVSGPLNITANFTASSAPSIVVAPGARTSAGPEGIVVALTLSNRGVGPAGDLVITGIDGFRDLSGTGAAGTVVLSLFPLSVGTVFPNQSQPASVTLLWPATSTRMQMVVHYSANGGAYTGSATLSVFR
jgi:cytolysin (calcineurin-like family phosphatase)